MVQHVDTAGMAKLSRGTMSTVAATLETTMRDYTEWDGAKNDIDMEFTDAFIELSKKAMVQLSSAEFTVMLMSNVYMILAQIGYQAAGLPTLTDITECEGCKIKLRYAAWRGIMAAYASFADTRIDVTSWEAYKSVMLGVAAAGDDPIAPKTSDVVTSVT
jgi:hypothetical protein